MTATHCPFHGEGYLTVTEDMKCFEKAIAQNKQRQILNEIKIKGD